MLGSSNTSQFPYLFGPKKQARMDLFLDSFSKGFILLGDRVDLYIRQLFYNLPICDVDLFHNIIIVQILHVVSMVTSLLHGTLSRLFSFVRMI